MKPKSNVSPSWGGVGEEGGGEEIWTEIIPPPQPSSLHPRRQRLTRIPLARAVTGRADWFSRERWRLPPPGAGDPGAVCSQDSGHTPPPPWGSFWISELQAKGLQINHSHLGCGTFKTPAGGSLCGFCFLSLRSPGPQQNCFSVQGWPCSRFPV